jgi:hypothetical protein
MPRCSAAARAFALGFDGYQVGTPSRDGLIAAAQWLSRG